MYRFSEIINESLKIYDLLERYHVPGRGGRTSCPLHHGKDANFAYNDRVYYCFVCGAKGNVITLAKELHNTDFKGAVSILNRDFCLHLPLDRKMTLREKHALEKRKKELVFIRELNQAEEEIRDRNYQLLWGIWDMVFFALRHYRPKAPEDMVSVSDIYLLALKIKPKIEYMIDYYL